MATESLDRGQAAPGAALTDLYTCPAATEALVTVTVSNTGAADYMFRLTRAPLGVADAASHYRAKDTVIPAGEQMIYTVACKATDVIRCYGSNAAVVFHTDIIARA